MRLLLYRGVPCKEEGAAACAAERGNIAQEIAWLYHKQGVRLFQFHDDNFLQAKRAGYYRAARRADGGAGEREGGLRPDAFLIKARPDSITEKVAFKLRNLGVVGVFLGVENASESGLFSLIRGSEVTDIDRAFERLFQHGIIVTYNLLIFYPDATLDEINENILFMKNHPGIPVRFRPGRGRGWLAPGTAGRQRRPDQGNWPNWDYQLRDPAR